MEALARADAAVARRRPDPDARPRQRRRGRWRSSTSPTSSCSPSSAGGCAVRRLHAEAGRADGRRSTAPIGRAAGAQLARRRGHRAAAATATTSPTVAPGRSSSPASSSRSSTCSRSASASASWSPASSSTARPIPYAEFVAPGHARRLGDERRAARLDVQLLLQAEVQQALRPDAGHAADHDRHRPRRAELVAAARRHLLRGVPAGDGRDGAGALVVGGAGRPGRAADRLRLRRRRAWR